MHTQWHAQLVGSGTLRRTPPALAGERFACVLLRERNPSVIGYVMVGTNNFDATAKFYDELLSVLGASRQMDEESFIAWGTALDQPMFSVTKPFDTRPTSSR